MRAAARWLTALACALLTSAAAQAQVARVIEARGAAMVERAGQPPRLLGAGERLDARDTVSVAPDSWAILEFTDQTRITLRPNTVFRIDAYSAGAPESAMMGLVKGGFRAVTGWIGKRNPQAMLVRTSTATIRIRGTEFDARLCEEDCAAEERSSRSSLPDPRVAGRVVELDGEAIAARAGQAERRLVPGATLHEGDSIVSGVSSRVLVLLADDARVSLGASSALHIDRFRFATGADGATLVVLAGKVGVHTGRLARLSPASFRVLSPLGEIRPRGTTFVVESTPWIAASNAPGPQTPASPVVELARVPDALLAVLDALLEKVGANARSHDLANQIARMNPQTGSFLPDVQALLLASRDGQTGGNAILDLMRQMHTTLTGHPNYGPGLEGLRQPSASEVSDPERMAALLRSWFETLDNHFVLGAGFEDIDARAIGLAGPAASSASAAPASPPVTPASISVSVSEGAVDVMGPGRTRSIDKGTRLVRDARGGVVQTAYAPALNFVDQPNLAKVAPAGTAETGTANEPGLYVWVRDGTVQLAKDGQTVDVAAGNAAVATKDRIALLDAVPNFLRFDPTPVPAQGAVDQVAEIFRAGDGSLFGSCKVQ
jgi:hypothetical protein